MTSEVGEVVASIIVEGNDSFPSSKSSDETLSHPPLVKKFWMLFSECVYRDFSCVLKCAWHRIVYMMEPHKYRLNRDKIERVQEGSKKVAKIVLLAHGVGGYPSNFLSLAKTLYEAGIENVYTVDLNCVEDEIIPIKSLAARIQEVAQKYLDSGYEDVEVSIVGHSLGAITAAAYAYREVEHMDHVSISKVISLAGRLWYVRNPFFWFCEGLIPEIQKTYEKIKAHHWKSDLALYTIWGDRDGVVPKQSVHIQDDETKEYTVEGRGHLGVLFASDAQKKIAEWLMV